MTDLQQIKLVNQLPLNRAAMQYLPKEWQDNQELHVLALMRWGLENGVEIKPMSPSHPTQEQVESMINRLAQAKPKQAIKFLTEVDGEIVLNEDALEGQESPEDAASLLLETLYDAMAAKSP